MDSTHHRGSPPERPHMGAPQTRTGIAQWRIGVQIPPLRQSDHERPSPWAGPSIIYTLKTTQHKVHLHTAPKYTAFNRWNFFCFLKNINNNGPNPRKAVSCSSSIHANGGCAGDPHTLRWCAYR